MKKKGRKNREGKREKWSERSREQLEREADRALPAQTKTRETDKYFVVLPLASLILI